MLPSVCVRALLCARFVCEVEAESEPFRAGGSVRAVSLFWMKLENIASAAASVGSSRLVAAGVPVLDRDRLVDLPNEPVSGAVRRGALRDPPSVLEGL